MSWNQRQEQSLFYFAVRTKQILLCFGLRLQADSRGSESQPWPTLSAGTFSIGRVPRAFSTPRGLQSPDPWVLQHLSVRHRESWAQAAQPKDQKNPPKHWDGNHWKGPLAPPALIASSPITSMALMDLIAELLKRQVTYYGSLFTAN